MYLNFFRTYYAQYLKIFQRKFLRVQRKSAAYFLSIRMFSALEGVILSASY